MAEKGRNALFPLGDFRHRLRSRQPGWGPAFPGRGERGRSVDAIKKVAINLRIIPIDRTSEPRRANLWRVEFPLSSRTFPISPFLFQRGRLSFICVLLLGGVCV